LDLIKAEGRLRASRSSDTSEMRSVGSRQLIGCGIVSLGTVRK
jgi:hypothetical protein